MSRARVALAVCVAALVCAGGAAGARAGSPTVQELTITGSGGVQLACGLVLPAGTAPAGGWPGLLLFPRFGFTHSLSERQAEQTFAPAGFASLTCDPRGSGASGGSYDLAGPADVADARALFDWLAARPDVSDTEIGAYGETVGGAEALNAAVAGVPFKAIVPADTWTSLTDAVQPHGVVNTVLFDTFEPNGPSDWDTPAGLAARSSRPQLHSLAVPTLLVQRRDDLLFDLRQATAAYKLLPGPKRLYIGNLQRPLALQEAVAWFREYLAGGPAVGGGVEIEHEPWDKTTTTLASLPPTRHVSVNLPGTTRLTGAKREVVHSVLKRSVRLPGGPFDTFGDGSLTVRYSGASKSWTELVVVVTVPHGPAETIEGAAPIDAPAGVVKIPLLDEMILDPRGRRIAVTVQSASPVLASVFQRSAPPAGAHITIGRMTLELSVLQRAVDR